MAQPNHDFKEGELVSFSSGAIQGFGRVTRVFTDTVRVQALDSNVAFHIPATQLQKVKKQKALKTSPSKRFEKCEKIKWKSISGIVWVGCVVEALSESLNVRVIGTLDEQMPGPGFCVAIPANWAIKLNEKCAEKQCESCD